MMSNSVSLNAYITDEQLLALMQKGDRAAFVQLYKKYWRRLFDSAYKRLLTREECEDIVQEIFIDLWAKRDKILITASIEAYLFGALRYQIYNRIRSRKVQESYLNSLTHTPQYQQNPIEDWFYYEELSMVLEKSIENMPEKFRRAYWLSRKENLSYKEIASQLSLPIDTVEKHIGKALKILRKNLKDFV